jgi:hypothetical protein
MFEDDDRDDNEDREKADERASDPATRARERADFLRMHAELVAVFEGKRKFERSILPGLDPEVARDVQKRIARLEKSKTPDSPVLPPDQFAAAAEVLDLYRAKALSTGDYHVYRRPGEVMVVRWLAGGEVETFYTRLQAHLDAALEAFKADERQQHGWKQEPQTLKYLEALDALEVKMDERYLRPLIRQHELFVLSTQAADEMDIIHLTNYVMGVEPAELVGKPSAPPDDGATERDRAWFFKLFALRGTVQSEERMCFFAYLQKADEEAW